MAKPYSSALEGRAMQCSRPWQPLIDLKKENSTLDEKDNTGNGKPKDQVAQTLEMMIAFFDGDQARTFVAAMARLNAHYYNTLIQEGVPTEAAATMAAQFKGPGEVSK